MQLQSHSRGQQPTKGFSDNVDWPRGISNYIVDELPRHLAQFVKGGAIVDRHGHAPQFKILGEIIVLGQCRNAKSVQAW